jgi:beta-glucanase (GH16 family)
MKILLTVCLWACLFVPAAAQCPALIWSDEFDGTSLNSSIWEHQIGDGCDLGQDLCGWGNAELQYYRQENAIVSDGTLKIITKKEDFGGKAYTSSRIRTLGKAQFDLTLPHLKIEARLKVPAGKGLWPAFWMLPSFLEVSDWPLGGEIDIMEFIGREPNNAHGYLHYGDAWNDRSIKGGPIRTPDHVGDDFHLYAIEKTPNQISFFFDGHLFQTFTNDDVEPKFVWPFESTFHFILNLAVGGFWPESPTDANDFPAQLEVDHVRIYDLSAVEYGHITGSRLVYNNQGSTEYCIEDGMEYQSIVWTVPVGATFTETSSTCISVDFGTESGYVQAQASSACEEQLFRVPVEVQSFYVKEFALVTPDASGDSASFLLSTGSYTIETVDGEPVVNYVRNISEVYDTIQYSTTAIVNPMAYVNGDKKFYMDIKSSTAAPCTRVLLNLENSSTATPENYPTGRHSRYISFIGKTDEWQRLEFDYYDQLDLTTTNVDRIVVLIDSFVERSDQYYFRNLDSATSGCTGSCEPLSTNQCRTRAKSEAGACTDGINNDGVGYDGDGPIDCEDSDCWDDPACQSTGTKPTSGLTPDLTPAPAPQSTNTPEALETTQTPMPASATQAPLPPAPVPTEPSTVNPLCSAHQDCADLAGPNCCPNPEGTFLDCCGTSTGPPPTTPDSSRSTVNPLCSAHPDCADLAGPNCCPTPEGTFIDCCSTSTEPPPTTPPLSLLAVDSLCSAHPDCADLAGDCCPTFSGIFLDCCG